MSIAIILSKLGEGMLRSISIFFLTLLFSLPLGLVVAFARMSKITVLRTITKVFISIMRGTPLMLQLLVVYFGPYYLFGMNIGGNYRFIAIIVGFSINYSAYFAEIYRSGIESMSYGQYEAARVLGYSRTATFMMIILPQVIKRILPAITNEVITLVKDTSLSYALSYSEMFSTAKQIAAGQTTLVPLAVAAVFYYIFNLVVALVMERIEKAFAYYR